jgi:hypothetical protein
MPVLMSSDQHKAGLFNLACAESLPEISIIVVIE